MQNERLHTTYIFDLHIYDIQYIYMIEYLKEKIAIVGVQLS